MTTTILDNEVLDQPTISPNSAYFKVKSAKVKAIATGNDALVVTEPSSNNFADSQYNKVTITQSGHVEEWDDTPGAERICFAHKDGHFVEMSKNGSVTKIFGNDFEIILQDKTLSVSGALNITVNGDCNMLIAGNAKTKIKGNDERFVEGNSSTYVKGTYNIVTEKNFQVESLQNVITKSRGNTLVFSYGDLTLAGAASMTHTTKGTLQSLVGGQRLSTSNTGHVTGFSFPSRPASSNAKFGLGFSTSLIEPSATELFLNKAESASTLYLRDPTVTYPKNRTPL